MNRKEKSLPNPTNRDIDEATYGDFIAYRGFQPINEDIDAEPPTSGSAVKPK